MRAGYRIFEGWTRTFRHLAPARRVLVRARMRRLLAFALAALPTAASAGPVSIGVGAGLTEARTQSQAGAGANDTYSLYGRLALAPRLGVQLELQRADTAQQNVSARSGSALFVLDLGMGNVVPVLLAGGGIDRAGPDTATTEGHHLEAGLGLEIRTQSGLVLGIDGRIGQLDIDSQPPPIVALFCGPNGCPSSAPTLQAGDYRSIRVTAGMRF